MLNSINTMFITSLILLQKPIALGCKCINIQLYLSFFVKPTKSIEITAFLEWMPLL